MSYFTTLGVLMRLNWSTSYQKLHVFVQHLCEIGSIKISFQTLTPDVPYGNFGRVGGEPRRK